MDNELEISLSDILQFIKKRFLLIVLCGVYFTVGTFLVSHYLIPEKYTASVSMYVNPNADEKDRVATLGDLNYAQAVVDTYIEILKTNVFLTDVAQTSALPYNPAELRKMVNMQEQNGTEIFKISVVSENPNDSLLLAETIAHLAPQKIIEVKDADAVRVVDPAILPTAPSSPNVMRNTVLGAALGLMLGVLIAFVLEMTDKRIKNEDDLLKNYNVPVLGTIPSVER